jgi:hypothetical protein
LKTEITVLGHQVVENGVGLDPIKVEAVRTWVLPQKQRDLSRFVGFCSFLRGNVRHFAELMAPLNAKLNKQSKNVDVKWDEDSRQVFDLVKSAIASAPTVKFIDWLKRLALRVDASKRGVGGILYQPDNPTDAPSDENTISFTSRALLRHEKNYHAYKLELLALVYCLVTFEHYRGWSSQSTQITGR